MPVTYVAELKEEWTLVLVMQAGSDSWPAVKHHWPFLKLGVCDSPPPLFISDTQGISPNMRGHCFEP